MPGASARKGPSRGNLLHGLLDDFDAFAHFGDAHLVTRVAIAGGLRRHVEVEFFVARIGEELADVVGHAAGAQAGGRKRRGRWRHRRQR